MAGLGAGLGYALYSIFSRFAIERGYNSLTITFYTFFIAAVGSMFLADRTKVADVVLSSPYMCIFSIVFGLVCTVIPYLLYTVGLNYVENSKAAIIASVEPVAATFIGFFVFDEKLSITGLLGMILVLSAMVICNGKNDAGYENDVI